MTDNEPTEQTFNDPWWPGIAIFGITFVVMMFNTILAASLGLMLLFLNWLRMGKPRKVFLVSLLSIFVFVLWLFTDYDRSDVQILDKWGALPAIGQITLLVLGIGVLALIGGNDLRKFRKKAQEPRQISKWAGLSILLFLVSAYLVTWFGLNLFSRQMGYCKFPTVYDLIAERQESQVDGLGRLLAQRKDLGCGWVWKNEVKTSSNFTFLGDKKFINGWYTSDQIYFIEQIIADKNSYAPSAIGPLSYFEGSPITVNIREIPQADFVESKCIGDGIIRECAIVVGVGNVVYGLDVRGVIFSDPDHFEMTVNTILESAVVRIVEYENSLP